MREEHNRSQIFEDLFKVAWTPSMYLVQAYGGALGSTSLLHHARNSGVANGEERSTILRAPPKTPKNSKCKPQCHHHLRGKHRYNWQTNNNGDVMDIGKNDIKSNPLFPRVTQTWWKVFLIIIFHIMFNEGLGGRPIAFSTIKRTPSNPMSVFSRSLEDERSDDNSKALSH